MGITEEDVHRARSDGGSMEVSNPESIPRVRSQSGDEIVAALALARSRSLRSYDKVGLVRKTGSFQEALRLIPTGVSAEALRKAEEQYKRCQKRGFHLMTLDSPHYPPLLKDISDPPLVLYVWGELDSFTGVPLAIVGSRRATPYGIDVCQRLSTELAERGATIVSGLARGIDAVAHRATLDAGGRTIAVLGSGLDVIYPREHVPLAAKIAETASVVSELPLGSRPLPGHFPMRNRIVSGMAVGTIVIEAAERSGSLISARLAVEENREVFAVPGPITSPTSDGVHGLIQDGAKLVRRAEDVVEELRPSIREQLSSSTRAVQSPAKLVENLEGDERRVVEVLLLEGAVETDRLVALAQIPTDRLIAALVGLEIRGFVRSFPGGFYGIGNPS
jgi:DNA processing protein